MHRSYPTLTGYAQRPRRSKRLRVLVISPHPDDDVLGCGGTLLRLATRGARIRVVYVTDGSASHVRSKRFPPEVLRDIREGEARNALRTLGIAAGPRFLRAPDGRLGQLAEAERSAIVTEIARTIDRLRPQLLFSPWQRDPHPDHLASAAFVDAALARCRHRPATYLYGVWLPIRGTAADAPTSDEARVHHVRLTPAEVAAKRTAILQHRSQTSGLIDDDPNGFRIDAALLAQWLTPVERFFRADQAQIG